MFFARAAVCCLRRALLGRRVVNVATGAAICKAADQIPSTLEYAFDADKAVQVVTCALSAAATSPADRRGCGSAKGRTGAGPVKYTRHCDFHGGWQCSR